MIRENPTLDMEKQSTVRKARRQDFHRLEQRDKMLAKPTRDYIALIEHLGFLAGLRFGEILVINPAWIYIAPDGSHGSIRVQPTKIELRDWTKAEWEPKADRWFRTIPMHEKLIAFLKNYGMRHPYLLAPDNTLFPTDEMKSLRFHPKRLLAKPAKDSGAGETNYYKLRHSFGTHLAMGGVTMAGIAGLLGITVKVVEETYADYSPAKTNKLTGTRPAGFPKLSEGFLDTRPVVESTLGLSKIYNPLNYDLAPGPTVIGEITQWVQLGAAINGLQLLEYRLISAIGVTLLG